MSVAQPIARLDVVTRETLPRGKGRLRRAVVEEQQRVRIMNAMLEASAERGFLNMRVSDVIGIAKLSRRTYYDLFSNRIDAFDAACVAASEILFRAGRLAVATRPRATWTERLAVMLDGLLAAAAQHRAAARVLVVEILAAHPKRDGLARRTEAFGPLVALMEEAQLASDGPELAVEIAAGCLYAILGTDLWGSGSRPIAIRSEEVFVLVATPVIGLEQAVAERDRLMALGLLGTARVV